MDDDGLGAVSNIIAGLEYVAKESRFTLRPSVISLNIRVRPGDIALDAAVQSVSVLGTKTLNHMTDHNATVPVHQRGCPCRRSRW